LKTTLKLDDDKMWCLASRADAKLSQCPRPRRNPLLKQMSAVHELLFLAMQRAPQLSILSPLMRGRLRRVLTL
jgi:hypothetical protein